MYYIYSFIVRKTLIALKVKVKSKKCIGHSSYSEIMYYNRARLKIPEKLGLFDVIQIN
jgi:hypothetical protein